MMFPDNPSVTQLRARISLILIVQVFTSALNAAKWDRLVFVVLETTAMISLRTTPGRSATVTEVNCSFQSTAREHAFSIQLLDLIRKCNFVASCRRRSWKCRSLCRRDVRLRKQSGQNHARPFVSCTRPLCMRDMACRHRDIGALGSGHSLSVRFDAGAGYFYLGPPRQLTKVDIGAKYRNKEL